MSDKQTDPVEAVARALAQDGLRADEQPCSEPLFRKRVEAWKPRVRIAIAAYRDALEASGWRVVPVHPTASMQNAGSVERYYCDGGCSSIYRAMLSAAPTPEDDDEG